MNKLLKKRNLELAKMLYSQNKYEKAEKILMETIETANAKFLMGKICVRTGRTEEAIEWFEDAKTIRKDWVAPRMELAKLYYEKGNWDAAKQGFDVCLKREPKNPLIKTAVAHYYASMGEKEEAKKLLAKALNIDGSSKVLKEALFVYDKMEEYKNMYDICEKLSEGYEVRPNEYRVIECMAKTYFNLGKYDKVLNVFQSKKDDRVTRTLFGLFRQKIYCELNKDKELSKIYQEILENMEAVYGEEGRIVHIQKHTKNDTTRKIHGVFTMDLNEVLDKVKNAKKIKQEGNGCDIYCIKMDGCGYEGGSEGDGHILNYVTLITFPDTEKPITLFPSDKVVIKEKTFNPGGEDR